MPKDAAAKDAADAAKKATDAAAAKAHEATTMEAEAKKQALVCGAATFLEQERAIAEALERVVLEVEVPPKHWVFGLLSKLLRQRWTRTSMNFLCTKTWLREEACAKAILLHLSLAFRGLIMTLQTWTNL